VTRRRKRVREVGGGGGGVFDVASRACSGISLSVEGTVYIGHLPPPGHFEQLYSSPSDREKKQ